MPDTSALLSLPFLAPAQAQKHVTHNEALERLDIVVQLSVESFDADTPPGLPEDGRVYALGAAPQGGWAGQAGHLAARIDGAWQFIAPRPGWRAVQTGTAALRIWDGTSWVLPLADRDNLDGIGVGTASDPVNRLSVASDAALFSHAGAGHQVKINKAAATDTAGLLLQSDWTGHAELALAGDTDLSIKVSADGTTWTEALAFDAATGAAHGAAVQANTADPTPERLMAVGAFGLGGAALTLSGADDLNALTASGFYYNSAASNTPGNSYPVATAGSLLNLRRSSTNWTQHFTSFSGTSTAGELRCFSRSHGLAGWSPWVEMLHQGRVLGAVSQSGGVPTGRVIEHGTNANGDYVRFADGTQICTHAIALGTLLAVGNGSYATPYATASATWVFPAAFASAPRVSGSALALGGGIYDRAMHLNITNSSATSAGSINAVRTTASSIDMTPAASLMAIGRWF